MNNMKKTTEMIRGIKAKLRSQEMSGCSNQKQGIQIICKSFS